MYRCHFHTIFDQERITELENRENSLNEEGAKSKAALEDADRRFTNVAADMDKLEAS